MSTQPKTHLTPEQYLEIERKAEIRHEYLNGNARVLPGINEAHCFARSECRRRTRLATSLKSLPRFPRGNESPVTPEFYTYPDVIVISGEARFLGDRRDTLLNPQIIIEVLSPSTEAYDRGRKFELYKAIESLREYLLLASDRVHADLYSRQADTRWILTSADSLEESLTLESVGAHLKLSDLYEKAELSV